MKTPFTYVTHINKEQVWIIREVSESLYGRNKDVLLGYLHKGAIELASEISELPNLKLTLSPEAERKLVFKLEALFNIRRELLREAGTA